MPEREWEVCYVPNDRWLVWLAAGWQISPRVGHHAPYGVLAVREIKTEDKP